MVKEIRYISINRVLDSLHDHPMLSDLTLEQAVRYALRFISINGLPRMFEDRTAVVDIHDFRGLLPCDLISIVQVMDCATGMCLRSMTNNFYPDRGKFKRKDERRRVDKSGEVHHHPHHGMELGIPGVSVFPHVVEQSFKTQGRIIYTSFPKGKVDIAYKGIPVDDDGFPMLIDNENYLAALEAYIKKQVFTVKFEQGKISAGILENAKQDYAWLAGQLQSEFTIPSVSEMQSITNMFNMLVIRKNEFYNKFATLGGEGFNKVKYFNMKNVATGFGAPADSKDDFTPSEAPSGGSSKKDCDTAPLTDNELNEIFGDQSQPVVEDVDALTDEELNEIFSN